MNAALSCIEDTIRLLLDEAKEAQQAAAEERGTSQAAYEVGRSQALLEALHTWSNQLRTFEIEDNLPGVGEELRTFLADQGY